MATKMNFEEYKKSKENTKPEMRLRETLTDIGCVIPILTGTVRIIEQDRPEKLYIVQVHEIGRLTKIRYPYSDAPDFRILIQPVQRKNLQQGDKIVFLVDVVDPLEQRTMLLRALKIKKIEDVENQVGDLNSLSLNSLAKLISMFAPIGNQKLEKAVQQFYSIDETIEEIEEANQKHTEEIRALKTLKDLIGTQSELERMASNAATVNDTLDRLNREKLPDEDEIKKRYSDWTKLLDKVNKVSKHIDHISKLYSFTYPDKKRNLPKTPIDSPSKISISEIQSRMYFKYSENRILSFLMALNTSQIIILHGKPGTGKSMFARQISKAIGADYEPVEVQNNWTDASDLIGYYNPMYKRYQSTQFLAAIQRAEADPDRIHIICLEEMNLARVEYYFALFLNMLQQDDPEFRVIHLLPDDVESDIRRLVESEQESETYSKEIIDHLKKYKSFLLPNNLRFIATINDDDYTNALSPKVIDRSFFIGFDTREEDEGKKNNPIPIKEYYSTSCFSIATNESNDNAVEAILGSAWNPQTYRRNNYISQMYSFLKEVSKVEKLHDLLQSEAISRNMIYHPTMEE